MEMPKGKMRRDACTNLHFTKKKSLFQVAGENPLNVTKHKFHSQEFNISTRGVNVLFLDYLHD